MSVRELGLPSLGYQTGTDLHIWRSRAFRHLQLWQSAPHTLPTRNDAISPLATLLRSFACADRTISGMQKVPRSDFLLFSNYPPAQSFYSPKYPVTPVTATTTIPAAVTTQLQ